MVSESAYIKVKLLLLQMIITCFFMCGFYQLLQGQNAPVTTISIAGTALPGQQVSVQVSVTNFSNIGSVSLSLDYDNTMLTYVSATINSQLLITGNFNAGDNNLGNGMHRLISGWYGNGTYLADGSVLLTYVFIYRSGSSLLQWFDSGASCAYTNDIGNFLNDIPFSAYYHNGMICGALPAPGIINGPASVCSGATGSVYSTNPIASATGYLWSIPAGSVIVGNANSNSVIIDFPVNAVSGNITVKGINDCGTGLRASIPVLVSQPPVANAGNDTSIWAGNSATLHGFAGNSPSVNYHWIPENLFVNPNVRNPQTVGLTTTTTFTLEVTNTLTYCKTTDQVIVTVNDLLTGITPVVLTRRKGDINENDFLVYPNPAKGHFFVRSDYFSDGLLNFSVISVNGTTVKNCTIINFTDTNDNQIDVSDLRPGIYFIRIDIGTLKIIKRVIIL